MAGSRTGIRQTAHCIHCLKLPGVDTPFKGLGGRQNPVGLGSHLYRAAVERVTRTGNVNGRTFGFETSDDLGWIRIQIEMEWARLGRANTLTADPRSFDVEPIIF